MNAPRKHHYIPIFYLKQWSQADGKIFEYKKLERKIAERRTHPSGTGYRTELYHIKGLPSNQPQDVEIKFMRPVDTKANDALKKILNDDGKPWDHKMRSAWARFIMSLIYRNPESVEDFNAKLVDEWNTALQDIKSDYDEKKTKDDPATFDEFRAQLEPEAPYKSASNLLKGMIDNPRIGQTIFDMHWSRIELSDSRISLLTSDRPLEYPIGLGNPNAFITLPIGPKNIFLAARDPNFANRIANNNHTDTAKRMNLHVVRQARLFVWGDSNKQQSFITKHMSKAGD